MAICWARLRDEQVRVEERAWRIYPRFDVHIPQGLELAVYDPKGDTAAGLVKAGVEFTRLKDLAKVTGHSLIIGAGCADDAAVGRGARRWRISSRAEARR